MGWIPYDERIGKIIELGNDAGNVTVIDQSTQIPLPELINPGNMSIAQKTITALLNAFVADREAFIAEGVGPNSFDTISKQAPRIVQAIMNGKYIFISLQSKADPFR